MIPVTRLQARSQIIQRPLQTEQKPGHPRGQNSTRPAPGILLDFGPLPRCAPHRQQLRRLDPLTSPERHPRMPPEGLEHYPAPGRSSVIIPGNAPSFTCRIVAIARKSSGATRYRPRASSASARILRPRVSISAPITTESFSHPAVNVGAITTWRTACVPSSIEKNGPFSSPCLNLNLPSPPRSPFHPSPPLAHGPASQRPVFHPSKPPSPPPASGRRPCPALARSGRSRDSRYSSLSRSAGPRGTP